MEEGVWKKVVIVAISLILLTDVRKVCNGKVRTA